MVKDLTSGQLRYYGRVPCPVKDNVDPGAKGRIRIKHPVFGPSGWVYYLRTPGAWDVPSIGDLVYAEAEWGNPLYLVTWGNLTKGADEADIPAVFKRKSPTNRGLYTPGGHLIELDDGINPTIDAGSTQKGIRITTASGKQINIDDTNNQIIITDSTTSPGNFIKIDTGSDSITIDCLQNVHINCVNATVSSTGTSTVVGANIVLQSSNNTINGGVVTDNLANADPITGIPLTPAGGITTSS